MWEQKQAFISPKHERWRLGVVPPKLQIGKLLQICQKSFSAYKSFTVKHCCQFVKGGQTRAPFPTSSPVQFGTPRNAKPWSGSRFHRRLYPYLVGGVMPDGDSYISYAVLHHCSDGSLSNGPLFRWPVLRAEQWAVETTGCWNNGLSEQRVGPSYASIMTSSK